MSTTLTRQKFREITADVQSAIAEVAKQHGVTLRCGGGRFSPTDGHFKIEVSTGVSTEDAYAAEAKAYCANCAKYGLKPEFLGKTLDIGGQKFVLVGMKTSSPKYPFLGKKGNKVFKLQPSDVFMGLGLKVEFKFDVPGRGREIDPELLAARRGLV